MLGITLGVESVGGIKFGIVYKEFIVGSGDRFVFAS